MRRDRGDMSSNVATKLSAARARLCMEKPFLGALVVHLPFEAHAQCGSIGTDARKLYFNPEYVDQLTLAETQFVLAHVALHCGLGHFARRGHRIRRRWDVACDHAVNALLVDEGLKAPAGALLDARFRGMAAEEIYPLIHDDSRERPLDRHAFEGSVGARDESAAGATGGATSAQSPDTGRNRALCQRDTDCDAAPSAESRDVRAAASVQALLRTWQMRLAAAAQQAQQLGCLTSSWRRLLDRVLAPPLPWRALLARYLAAIARDDYSFQRPARREGPALLPRLHSQGIDVCVVLDTSGSIADTLLNAFVAEIDALKSQVRARVTVHACDCALAPDGPWVAESWERIALPVSLSGGGGTDFRPPFDWIERQGLRPDVLIYLTDAEGQFPPAPPPYPVLWLVKGRGAVPWGERIQLN